MATRSPLQLSGGIDEAGRGCVLGPLVVAVVVATAKDRRWFAEQNVRDSKLVPPSERERLAEEIRKRCWFRLMVATPLDIDTAVADRTRTLNGLELELMSAGLGHVMEDFTGQEPDVLVDAPSINAEGFRKKLHTHSGWLDSTRLRAEHHADRDNRTVGAASIVAKSERERLIDILKQELGFDFGSGYPHDERTITHIKSVARDATHVRWSWATAKRWAAAN